MRYTQNINLPIVEDNDLYSKEINNLAFEKIDEEIQWLADIVETLDTPENSIADVKKDINDIKSDVVDINEQLDTIEKKVNDHIESCSGGGTSIDDTTISTDRTWSSAKTESFVLTNDNVVWSTVQGENLSVDYTKEGYLREVEIWGNTWQDTYNSKNLFNKDNVVLLKETVNEATSYTVEGNTVKFEITDLQIEEGTIATDYVDYHKADLSDIQHLGELYVDEEGQPILDNEGREQYKIEVESVNGNLFNYPLSIGDRIDNNGVSIQKNEKAVSCLEYIEVDIGEKYYICTNAEKEYYRLIMNYDENKNFIDFTAIGENKQTLFTAKSKYIRIVAENLKNDVTPINDIRFAVIKSDTKESYIPHKSHKTTLLLPCQLMKVGDVADRLYWDSVQGKYFVDSFCLDSELTWVENGWLKESTLSKDGYSYFKLEDMNIIPSSIQTTQKPPNVVSSLELSTYVEQSTNKFSCYFQAWNSHFIGVADTELETTDVNGFKKWLANNNVRIITERTTPQLIETTILEQIKIQCYKDKTHLFVTGGIDGTIKAKIPLDGGQAIQSLSVMNLALNEEVSTLSLENEELKSTNDTQDELINTTMLATDEMYMMIEPLLSEAVQTLSLERSVSKMADMYVAMVQRGLKTIDEVPARYREQVKEILAQLEK